MGKEQSHHNTIVNIIIFLLTITDVIIIITIIVRFVILHGTDTLAYTSSALSFMLENLGKPVIVTGLQRLHCSHNTFSEYCNCNQHHFFSQYENCRLSNPSFWNAKRWKGKLGEPFNKQQIFSLLYVAILYFQTLIFCNLKVNVNNKNFIRWEHSL